METGKKLYPSKFNPLLLKPGRDLPKEIAVIGAGTIGPDIAYYIKSALPEVKLYLVDVVEGPLKAAEKRFAEYAGKSVKTNRMTEDQARAVLANVSYTMDYNEIKNCGLVIEAATENVALKQRIFATVEKIVHKDAIITSNSSSIPADRIFSAMERPERTTITHFFGPAWRSLPVEVIVWEKGSREVADYLHWFFANTGKAPIATDNVICFMLDRVFCNWTNDAVYLLEHATASQVDSVMEEFVFAGPNFVQNMTNGNPILIEANTLLMEEGEHYRPAPLLHSVASWATHKPGAKVEVPDDLRKIIRDRMLGTLFSQSFDIVDRGIGTREDLNFGCQVALGFRKGPLDIMRHIGEEEVARIMARFENDRPGFPQPKAPFGVYQDFRRFVLVDDLEGVKVITIRRPQAMNALNDEITGEILSVLQEFSGDPSVEGFVITGYGKNAFCAGADIGRFPEMLGDSEASIQYTRDCAKVQEFMDRMEKPVVAAVNGFALGGGLEVAIRCHGIVATGSALFQFPEITLGILPGLGGCVVPYRKWPQGAALFHEMICLGRSLKAEEALAVGMVSRIEENYYAMVMAAVEEVKRLRGKIAGVPDGRVDIPEILIPPEPAAGKQPLSKEAVAIVVETVKAGAGAGTFAEALEICYRGFGRIACTEAAREGISAFLEKRKPLFKK